MQVARIMRMNALTSPFPHIAIAHAAENLLREGYDSTNDDDDA